MHYFVWKDWRGWNLYQSEIPLDDLHELIRFAFTEPEPIETCWDAK